LSLVDDIKCLTEKIAILVAIPGDPGDEGARLALCEEWLTSYDSEWQEVPDFGGNLLAHSRGEGPHVILVAHVDTVPAAPGWKTRPREPTIEAGSGGAGPRLVALGAADMLAGVAVAIEAFKAAAEADRKATLLLVCDEEGYSRGINMALAHEPAGDIALVPEPSGERPMLGARGRLVLELAVGGRSAHAARPDLGLSAAAAAASLVGPLEALECPPGPPLDPGGHVVLELEAKALGLSLPTLARMVVDRHTVIGEDHHSVVKAVEELACQALPDGAQIQVRLMERPTPTPEPYVVDPTEPLVAGFLSILEPEAREPIYGRSVGDYNFLASKMPTIVYGPRGGDWHAPGEWVDLTSTAQVLDTYRRFVIDG